jgi:enoyl-CoA hydratase/carnithine racemase
MADIELTLDSHLACITLNRPDKRNALTLGMWGRIPALISEASSAHSRAIILQGAGGHFAAGADIAEFAYAYANPQAALANHETMQGAMRAIEECSLPVLARIEGTCVGGGCALALACDLRWATPDARFAITPARLGLAYGVADTHRLVRAIGLSRAKELLFTARAINADTALAWGFIDRIVTAEAMQQELETVANALAGASRYSIAATKLIARKVAAGATSEDGESRTLFADAFSGADFAEGFAAFHAKRPPHFK